MAQKTTYTLLGIPGKTQSFTAKGAAVTTALQLDVLMAAGILATVPELGPLLGTAAIPSPVIEAALAVALQQTVEVSPLLAAAYLPDMAQSPLLAGSLATIETTGPRLAVSIETTIQLGPVLAGAV